MAGWPLILTTHAPSPRLCPHTPIPLVPLPFHPQSDPSGNYNGWRATCIGANEKAATSLLKQEYKVRHTPWRDRRFFFHTRRVYLYFFLSAPTYVLCSYHVSAIRRWADASPPELTHVQPPYSTPPRRRT